MTSATVPVDESAPPQALSLTAGGPLFRVERRLHLEASLLRTIGVLVTLTWAVGVAIAFIESLLRPTVSGEVLLKLGGHVRMLVGIPLLLLAERMFEDRVASASHHLVAHGIVGQAGLPAWHRIVRSAVRWRDAKWPELTILLVVLALTAAGISGLLPDGFLRWFAPTLHPKAVAELQNTAGYWWFVCVAQPIYLFLVIRQLYRWTLWGSVVWRLSRLPLNLEASHPDRAGGLGILQGTLDSFLPVVLAVSSSISATWADEIMAKGVKAATFAPFFLGQIALAFCIGIAPFVPLSPLLLRAKRAGTAAFAGLAHQYIDAFNAKWLRREEPHGPLLGDPDFQSLADVGSAFTVCEDMRITVISVKRMLRLVAFAVLPVAPLALYTMPPTEIAKRLFELAF